MPTYFYILFFSVFFFTTKQSAIINIIAMTLMMPLPPSYLLVNIFNSMTDHILKFVVPLKQS
jgi:hypothetical protein